MASSGRPIAYTSEFAELILSELADGKSLRSICADHPSLPGRSTIRRWIAENKDGFRDKYAHAKEEMLQAWAEDIVHIADESRHDTVETETGEHADTEWINRSRLRVDTRKWLLSKLLPKQYGDRQQLEHSGPDGGPVVLQWKSRSTTPPATKA